MKKTILLLFAAAVLSSGYAQEAEKKSYVMFDFIYLKPKYDKLKALGEAMAEHNRKFHAEGPFQAHVWTVESGAHTGWWAWVMGPCTYSHLDERPDSKEHLEHWRDVVMPNVDKLASANFWKLDSELSYRPEGTMNDKEIWTTFEIKPFEGYRFKEMLKMVKKVYEEKGYKNSFEVFKAELDDKNHGGVIIANNFGKWAFFDEDRHFKKDFEEVHGEGSFWKFMEEFKEVVVSVDDQLATYIPALSGGTEENK